MNRKAIGFLILGMLIVGVGATLYLMDPFWKRGNIQPLFRINGKEVKSFGYILQYDTYESRTSVIKEITEYPAELLVMEPMYTVQHASWWTPAELNQMKNGLYPKILIAYVSIGEAESYREYWNETWDANHDGIPDQKAPSWLDRENPDWKGNYKVKYWDPYWQHIIFGTPNSMIDKIMAQGFDGIYMDIIDAFEYYQEQGISDADKRMVEFVRNISAYARGIHPGFLIVPQNGEALSEYPEYMDAIDGIGREDVFFNGNQRQPPEGTVSAIESLTRMKTSGKFILVIEYPSIPKFQHEIKERCDMHGFLVYIGPRTLDDLAGSPFS